MFYYDVQFKEDCVVFFKNYECFFEECMDIVDVDFIKMVFDKYVFEVVFNLVVQFGVFQSFKDFWVYCYLNMVGFLGVLEVCRVYLVEYLIFVLMSFVYGVNCMMLFSEGYGIQYLLIFYVVSKKVNEMMVYNYVNLFGILCIGVCFFIVYGFWYWFDMVFFKFMKVIFVGEMIDVYVIEYLK